MFLSCVVATHLLVAAAPVEAAPDAVPDAAPGTAAEPAAPAQVSANLPLRELLELARPQEPPPAPPIGASLARLAITGRVMADTAELEVEAEVEVIPDAGWTRVVLLHLSESDRVDAMPVVDGGTLALDRDELVFVSQRSGRYHFTLRLAARPRRDGRRRSLQVRPGEPRVATMRVQVNLASVRLLGDATPLGDAYGLEVGRAGFACAWEVKSTAPAALEIERPPLEPRVERAHATLVTTLEGQRVIRVAYDLRLEGRQQLGLLVPPETAVRRLYVNGRSLPTPPLVGERLVVAVTPATAGDTRATVELVLAQDQGGFRLSGDLGLRFAVAEWPTREYRVDLFLPEVFTYQWTGGSLAPASAGDLPAYSFDTPVPGQRQSFSQQLVTGGMPHLRLQYTVNLAGRYHR